MNSVCELCNRSFTLPAYDAVLDLGSCSHPVCLPTDLIALRRSLFPRQRDSVAEGKNNIFVGQMKVIIALESYTQASP